MDEESWVCGDLVEFAVFETAEVERVLLDGCFGTVLSLALHLLHFELFLSSLV